MAQNVPFFNKKVDFFIYKYKGFGSFLWKIIVVIRRTIFHAMKK